MTSETTISVEPLAPHGAESIEPLAKAPAARPQATQWNALLFATAEHGPHLEHALDWKIRAEAAQVRVGQWHLPRGASLFAQHTLFDGHLAPRALELATARRHQPRAATKRGAIASTIERDHVETAILHPDEGLAVRLGGAPPARGANTFDAVDARIPHADDIVFYFRNARWMNASRNEQGVHSCSFTVHPETPAR